MTRAIVDDIDILSADRDACGRFFLQFRSSHAERVHQLYANGRLVAWTDSPDDRAFVLAASESVRQCTVAAVSQCDRATDLSDLIESSTPSWIAERLYVRRPEWPRDAWLQLLGDGAEGTIDAEPLAQSPAWSTEVPRWAWGEDGFGHGGFGYDGSAAPGFGKGAIGGGLFGFDERAVCLRAALGVDGTHQLATRLVRPDGSYRDGPIESLSVHPPPAELPALQLVDYDPATQRITLDIQGAAS